MKFKSLLLVSSLAVLASCSKQADLPESSMPETTASSNSAAKNNGKPFKGSISYHVNPEAAIQCNCDGNIPADKYTGSGNITHMGKVSSNMQPCISLIFSGSVPVGVNVHSVCGSIVAANGDILNVSTHPYQLMFTPSGAIGTAVYDINGGTGKFANASGTFTGVVTNDNLGNSTLTNINGTIAY